MNIIQSLCKTNQESIFCINNVKVHLKPVLQLECTKSLVLMKFESRIILKLSFQHSIILLSSCLLCYRAHLLSQGTYT